MWKFCFTVLATDKLQNLHPETAIVQPDITLRKILLGQPYSLEQYKSLASKTALLDTAIINGDGNAILIVILFSIIFLILLKIFLYTINKRNYILDYFISYKNS